MVTVVSLDFEDEKESLIKATLDVILVKQNIDIAEDVPRGIIGTEAPSVANRIRTSLALQVLVLLAQVLI